MTDSDTGVVEMTLHIRARPETVWRYWTDPARLADWWGTASELDARPGGRCRIETARTGLVMRGEFVEVVPHERIVFTFGWDDTPGAPALAPGSTLVEVTLVADDGATILTLRHTGLPAAQAGPHGQGWDRYLPALITVCAAAS